MTRGYTREERTPSQDIGFYIFLCLLTIATIAVVIFLIHAFIVTPSPFFQALPIFSNPVWNYLVIASFWIGVGTVFALVCVGLVEQCKES